jgi:hypothetical protein
MDGSTSQARWAFTALLQLRWGFWHASAIALPASGVVTMTDFLMNPFPSTFSQTLLEFYNIADWHPTTGAYLRDQGIDDKLVLARAGTAALFPCAFDGNGFFDFDEDGERCLVSEVLDEDAATAIDLCAFSVADPTRFGTADGRAPVLGMTNVTNPASWAFGNLLTTHHNPLEWLQVGCRGVVIMDYRGAREALGKALGKLLATDEDHHAPA